MTGTRSTLRAIAGFGATAGVLLFANGANAIPVVAWVAPLLLLRGVRRQRAWSGVWIAYLILVGTARFQFRGMLQLDPMRELLILAAFGVPLVLPYAVDRLLAPRLNGFTATLVFPAAFVASEYLMSFGPYGSWVSIAYTQYGNLPLLQILAVTGLWGVTFLIAWFASMGNWVWQDGWASGGARGSVAIYLLAATAIVLSGSIRMTFFPPDAPTARIASFTRKPLRAAPSDTAWNHVLANQASADELAAIRSATAEASTDLFSKLEREARAGARIIFWGETNATVLKDDEPAFVARGSELARVYEIYLGMAVAVSMPISRAWRPRQAGSAPT